MSLRLRLLTENSLAHAAVSSQVFVTHLEERVTHSFSCIAHISKSYIFQVIMRFLFLRASSIKSSIKNIKLNLSEQLHESGRCRKALYNTLDMFPLILLQSGTVSGLQLFLVLMLYVWLGIGLVCAGFCCQQVLLVARGQTWCQMRRGQQQENHSPWQANLKDVFGTRWILGLILPVQTVETCTEDTDAHKQD